MAQSRVDFKNAWVHSRRIVAGGVVLLLALGMSCWVGLRNESPAGFKKSEIESEGKIAYRRGSTISASEAVASDQAEPLNHAEIGGPRPPYPFRTQPEVASPVMMVLATGELKVAERVRQLQGMRGSSFSDAERETALAFLTGKELPKGMGRGSVNWISDELLTSLRLQEPPWDGLASALADVAFQPETNPVVRDYVVQHLGHLWEQYGAREEIEEALWKAVETADETTPGSALIALSRGYERDGQQQELAKVRQRAFDLAGNPETGLAVRVTALAIAGEGGGKEVKALVVSLTEYSETPVILRKVAERIMGEK